MTKQYVPDDIDIQWACNMVALIKSGGTLAYTDAQCIYTLWHGPKVLELTNPMILKRPMSALIHKRTIATFEKIGWTVKVAGA